MPDGDLERGVYQNVAVCVCVRVLINKKYVMYVMCHVCMSCMYVVCMLSYAMQCKKKVVGQHALHTTAAVETRLPSFAFEPFMYVVCMFGAMSCKFQCCPRTSQSENAVPQSRYSWGVSFALKPNCFIAWDRINCCCSARSAFLLRGIPSPSKSSSCSGTAAEFSSLTSLDLP